MKCKERKSKQCAKLVQILINLSILNYYIMVRVRTCTVSSLGAVRHKCQHLLVVPVPVAAEQDPLFSHFSEERGQSSQYFMATLSLFHTVWQSRDLVQSSKRSLRVFPSTFRFIHTAYQTPQKQNELPAPGCQKIMLECDLRCRGDWIPVFLSFLTCLERSTEKARTIKEHST